MVNVQFGIRLTLLIGLAKITTPISIIKFYIIKVNTLFLLCLADMDYLQVYFNNLKNILITPWSEVLVIYYFGHPFLLWNTSLYTTATIIKNIESHLVDSDLPYIIILILTT